MGLEKGKGMKIKCLGQLSKMFETKLRELCCICELRKVDERIGRGVMWRVLRIQGTKDKLSKTMKVS